MYAFIDVQIGLSAKVNNVQDKYEGEEELRREGKLTHAIQGCNNLYIKNILNINQYIIL